jgi:hypothetical protein
MNIDSNLLKLIMHGFALRLKADVAKKYLKQIRKRLIKIIGPFLTMIFPERIANFCIKAVRGFQARVKMSPEETYSIFKTHFDGIDLPDAADLIDELGLFSAEAGWIKYYDNVPFIKHMVDSLHDTAICDIEVGYTSEQRTFSLKFQTKGIKELFDLIMAGCVDA